MIVHCATSKTQRIVSIRRNIVHCFFRIVRECSSYGGVIITIIDGDNIKIFYNYLHLIKHIAVLDITNSVRSFKTLYTYQRICKTVKRVLFFIKKKYFSRV